MTNNSEYDSPWKEALEIYFQEFIQFFFPQAYEDIDWNRPYETLDQELQQLAQDATLGKRLADKLVKVWLKTGIETIVIIHIEIQGEYESNFAQRMFIYNYRIYDKFYQKNTEVISLAVLGDESQTWKPTRYNYDRWGFSMTMEFPVVKLLDYKLEELEAENNPFAIIVAAHLKTKSTKKNPQGRLQQKFNLIKKLYEKGYQKQDILRLFRLIDWMMVLPEELTQNFKQQLADYEEEKKVPYITSIERLGMEKGEIGMLKESIIELLEFKFSSIPEELKNTINNLDEITVLKQLFRQAMAVSSLEEFQELL